MEFLGLILGIGIIIIGAEIFIRGIESTSINFKIPRMFIILTVVAFGTSFPELIISFNAVSKGAHEIVFSNVIGSTIVNSMLIIGIASLIRPIKIKADTIKKELPIHMLAIALLSFLYLDSIWNKSFPNAITRIDALILILVFGIFLVYIISLIKKKDKDSEKLVPKYSLIKSVMLTILGLGLIIIGSNLTVDNAIIVAENLGITSKIVTMVFIVIGTSMPELILSIISSRKGNSDFIMGNIIGTNIFNICIVLGLPILLLGGVQSTSFNSIDIFVLIISGVAIFSFARNDRIIKRAEGILMILIFLAYYAYILI